MDILKKTVLLCCMLLGVQAHAAKPPFYGERSFDFSFESGSTQTIRIARDGTTQVTYCGAKGCERVYQGPFNNPLYLKRLKRYLLVKPEEIMQLMPNQQIARECFFSDEPCRSEYF